MSTNVPYNSCNVPFCILNNVMFLEINVLIKMSKNCGELDNGNILNKI